MLGVVRVLLRLVDATTPGIANFGTSPIGARLGVYEPVFVEKEAVFQLETGRIYGAVWTGHHQYGGW
jgi:hypothetical protein